MCKFSCFYFFQPLLIGNNLRCERGLLSHLFPMFHVKHIRCSLFQSLSNRCRWVTEHLDALDSQDPGKHLVWLLMSAQLDFPSTLHLYFNKFGWLLKRILTRINYLKRFNFELFHQFPSVLNLLLRLSAL
jgi:hypothetical protein